VLHVSRRRSEFHDDRAALQKLSGNRVSEPGPDVTGGGKETSARGPSTTAARSPRLFGITPPPRVFDILSAAAAQGLKIRTFTPDANGDDPSAPHAGANPQDLLPTPETSRLLTIWDAKLGRTRVSSLVPATMAYSCVRRLRQVIMIKICGGAEKLMTICAPAHLQLFRNRDMNGRHSSASV
jgi:hypothetical protein